MANQIINNKILIGEIKMNKATRTSLHAMRKSELIDFTWNLIQHYNEAIRNKDALQAQVERDIAFLERLLSKTREQAGNIRTGEGEQF